ncbi:MAG TPA: prephenate dehydrogenase/arogenate dehydrogenase family protein [Oscillatoriaceae cyanobacterium]
MRLAILGLGLMGGSLGLALSRREGWQLVGWDCEEAAIAEALRRGAINEAAASPAEAVATAELVCLAVPVQATAGLMEAIASHLPPDAVVTDLGSSKVQVCAWAAERLPGVSFVGGHPMAGSERAGIAAARADLLTGAVYVLTPGAECSSDALARVAAMAEAAGARPLVYDAVRHDADVALVSHLPFVLSAALSAIAGRDPHWAESSALAASGFRDVSRLASGDVAMHRDICLSNAAAIGPRLAEAGRLLSELAEHLEDPDYLERFFAEARQARENWLARRYPESACSSPSD